MRMLSPWGAGPSILMYHSIEDDSNDPFSISINGFREQVSWLSKNNFEIVSLSFLLKLIQGCQYKKLRKKVVITFDDGYKDFITNALPILKDSRAHATVFLVTDMLGGRALWNDSERDVRLMSEDEIRYIKARGISLGSHTATHANLKLLDRKEIQRQLRDSYNRLTRLGESFYAFSYPWAQWSGQIVEAVKVSGYECAVVAGGKVRLNAVNTYLLPRISMRRDMDLKGFESILQRTCLEMEIRRECRAMLNRFAHIAGKSVPQK